MANPSPPTYTYAAMGTRVGLADGDVLTTADINQITAYLVAQDGNGNAQGITSIRIGPFGFVCADTSDAVWLARNAYTIDGTNWYPFVETDSSYAVLIQSGTLGISIMYAPAMLGDGALTWQTSAQTNSTGIVGVTSAIASLILGQSTLTAGLAAETSRAEGAETSITTGLNAEIANRTVAIAAETSRAETAEATLTAGLSNEVARAETAETALGSSLATLQQQVAGTFINGAFCAGGTPPGTVDCATTGALPNFFYNPQATGDQIVFTSTTALSAIDGVSVNVATRILVKNQTGPGAQGAFANGLYVMTQQGDGVSNPVVLTRAADASTAAQLGGIKCLVNGGTTNGETIWVLPLASAAINIGTTQLLFSQVANNFGTVTSQAGTSYTLQPGDNNSTIIFTSSSAVTVTAPNSLPVGFNCKLEQGGTAQVSLVAASGATVNTPNQAMTTGRYGVIDCRVTANPGGTAAVWNAIASAPPNLAATQVTKTANDTLVGNEGTVAADATAGSFRITVPPASFTGRAPVLIYRTDSNAAAVVEIYDGITVIFALISPVVAGNVGGWCDALSDNGTVLRVKGIP